MNTHRHTIYTTLNTIQTERNTEIFAYNENSQEKSTLLQRSTIQGEVRQTFLSSPIESNSIQTPYRIPYQTQTIKLSRISSPSLSHACSPIDRSIEEDKEYSRTLDSRRERERRGREFLDPFSIVTRLMGEGSSVRLFEPVISPTLDSAGKTRPAAGRGTNGDPLRQEAISPCTGDTHYPPDMVKAGKAFKETWTERQKAGEPEGRLSHTLVWYLSISPIF